MRDDGFVSAVLKHFGFNSTHVFLSLTLCVCVGVDEQQTESGGLAQAAGERASIAAASEC